MLGGQSTAAGVSAMDVTFAYDRSINAYGLWAELLGRIRAVYRDELGGRPVNTARYRDDSFGPNVVVVERVLGQMLDEAGVTVLRSTRIGKASRSEAATVLYTDRGWIRARTAIDATETGSLLPLLEQEYRVGNALASSGEPPAGDLDAIAIQDITYTAVVRRYDDGLPAWATMTEAPPRYAELREEVRGAYPASPSGRQEAPNGFAGYRGVADLASDVHYTGSQWELVSRTSLNYRNDCPVAASYLERAGSRAAGDAEAICRTLAILYHLQHDLGLPWGLADDEGFADGPFPRRFPSELEPWSPMLQHLPLIPYVRESRRIVGRSTLTGKQIFRLSHHAPSQWNPDAIAVGTYPPDLHGGREPADLEPDLDESLSDKPREWREGPFPIPLGCLVPRQGEGLVAAEKNISASRIASGAIRLHPTVVATGEAAGTLAALAVRAQVDVGAVPTAAVQLSLIRHGALLSPARIEGVEPDDEAWAAVVFAVARQLVDVEYVRAPGGRPDPAVRVDLERARAAGAALIGQYSDWDRLAG